MLVFKQIWFIFQFMMNDKSVDVIPQYRCVGEVVNWRNATTSWTLTDDSPTTTLSAMQLTHRRLVKLDDIGQRKFDINEFVDNVSGATTSESYISDVVMWSSTTWHRELDQTCQDKRIEYIRKTGNQMSTWRMDRLKVSIKSLNWNN